MQYQHIIWDWNGTIVDDLELAVELANLELQAAGLPPLSAHQHRAAFQIPIIRYYEAIGMTMTPELAAAVDQAFHRNYDEARHRLTAFPDIFPAMQTLGTKSCKHSVLSALPHDLLTEHVEHLNLGSSFERVIGRTTTHAESKVEAGRKLIADLQLQPQHVLIIGDTIYDHEV
ncbi:MAG: HAD family hydrolase, partial [Deltaproteobacteria bacterium]|nr:HAD family hydrolase [Deltaproteobacteria bacterium]